MYLSTPVKNSGVVRVINRRTAERALFKKFTGQVIDLAFSHTDEVLIAIVDEIGNLLVSEIRENPDGKLVYPSIFIPSLNYDG